MSAQPKAFLQNGYPVQQGGPRARPRPTNRKWPPRRMLPPGGPPREPPKPRVHPLKYGHGRSYIQAAAMPRPAVTPRGFSRALRVGIPGAVFLFAAYEAFEAWHDYKKTRIFMPEGWEWCVGPAALCVPPNGQTIIGPRFEKSGGCKIKPCLSGQAYAENTFGRATASSYYSSVYQPENPLLSPKKQIWGTARRISGSQLGPMVIQTALPETQGARPWFSVPLPLTLAPKALPMPYTLIPYRPDPWSDFDTHTGYEIPPAPEAWPLEVPITVDLAPIPMTLGIGTITQTADWAVEIDVQPEREPVRQIHPDIPTRIEKPRVGENEGKVRHVGRAVGMSRRATVALAGAVGEVGDLVDSFWKALPNEIRRDVARKYSQELTDNYARGWANGVDASTGKKRRGLSTYRKVQAVYDNFDKVDLVKALEGIGQNAVEDFVIGKMSQTANQHLLSSGFWHSAVGPGFGLAL